VSLEAELAAEIHACAAGGAVPDFAAWSARIFRHQYEHNAPYRAFCDRRGVTPSTVARWQDVPAVPTAAFRWADLACGPPEAVFRTSGTSDAERRGRHLVPHLELYRASALAGFAAHLLPDEARVACVFLLPAPETRPDSSLVRMCDWIGERFGTRTDWLVGPAGLDLPCLCERLAALEATGEAVFVAGPTAGFARFFETGRTFRLGPGSRVMDTGGQKGMTRPLSRAGFLRSCWTALGIPGYLCINEYGMTELCSQRWDSALRDRFAGRSLAPRRLVSSPWLRTRVLDPDNLAEVADGTTGLLCHHDLANAGSVGVVLTDDLGRTIGEDGIEISGRVAGAMPRGCGMLLAALG